MNGRQNTIHVQKCIVVITDVEREYSYEYIKCTSRLVITPLTDCCYITLAQAFGLSMGGAPAGPAGTGKTETVKDMASALDIMCVDHISRGLVQEVCWGYLGEFNRIELHFISVAAQQVARVFNACGERVRTFKFTDGNMVDLDNRVAIFMTINLCNSYRQELSENL